MVLRAIIFDLDNTIIKCRVDFVTMKQKIIEELENSGYPKGGLSPTNQTTVKIIEEAEKFWEKIGKPEKERQNLREKMDVNMNQSELESIRELQEIPGVVESIKKIKEKGYRLAILTRGHHNYAVKALQKIGIDDEFDLIIGRGESPKPKPYREALLYTVQKLGVNITETVMVGDHQIDMDSATNSGCDFIGVSTGRHGLLSWKDKIPPPILLNSVKDLPEYLDKLQKI
jgi:HAD superfamily hydrolase (TIGR01549 family)